MDTEERLGQVDEELNRIRYEAWKLGEKVEELALAIKDLEEAMRLMVGRGVTEKGPLP